MKSGLSKEGNDIWQWLIWLVKVNICEMKEWVIVNDNSKKYIKIMIIFIENYIIVLCGYIYNSNIIIIVIMAQIICLPFN